MRSSTTAADGQPVGNSARATPYDSLIAHLDLDAADYRHFIESPFLDETLVGDGAVRLVVVRPSNPLHHNNLTSPGSVPVIVAWVGDGLGATGPHAADVVIGEADVDELVHAVAANPLAAVTLAVHLRTVEHCSIDLGLALESTAYSLLQGGPEFAAWRKRTESAPTPPDDQPVLLERTGGELTVTLNRPGRHNAINTALRDELAAALALAQADHTIRSVSLRGNGPSFSSGGDLAEFGSRANPVDAHIIRLARSPVRQIATIGNVTAHLHGAAYGGGIELAAFAQRVVADAATRIALPELSLGLIPGAGGTVSITRRCGRQRTAALALTGREITAPTALNWGLVDEVVGALDGPAASGLITRRGSSRRRD